MKFSSFLFGWIGMTKEIESLLECDGSIQFYPFIQKVKMFEALSVVANSNGFVFAMEVGLRLHNATFGRQGRSSPKKIYANSFTQQNRQNIFFV